MPDRAPDSAPEDSTSSSKHVSLAGLRLRPGKNALSENPIIFGAVRYAPLNLKRAIPRPVIELIRRLLSPRDLRTAVAPLIASEPLRDPTLDWLGPYFSSVGLHGPASAIFSSLRVAGYPVYESPAAVERVA